MNQNDPRHFLYAEGKLTPEEAQAIAAQTLAKCDDGELYLQFVASESFTFDDGRLKAADYSRDSGFGLRGISGEMTGFAHANDVSADAIRRAGETLQLLDPALQVSTVVSSGLTQPIGIVFLGSNDFLVPEKSSGQIKRVINGVVQAMPVLDLAVNSASERGLLSVVLHPRFPTQPYVYVRWTESASGLDSNAVADVPLLGNRVDRFTWDGSTLSFDKVGASLAA